MRSQPYRVNCNYQADANERVQLHESGIGFGHWPITIPHPANRYSHSSSTTFDSRPGREYVTPFSRESRSIRATALHANSTNVSDVTSRISHLCHCRIANRRGIGDMALPIQYKLRAWQANNIPTTNFTGNSQAMTRPAAAAASRTPRRTTRIVADKIALGGNAGTQRGSKEVKGTRGSRSFR